MKAIILPNVYMEGQNNREPIKDKRTKFEVPYQ